MTDKTYNEQQKSYIIAKANLDALEIQVQEIEQNYIVENGIKNLDGTIPSRIFCIRDKKTFEKANKESSKLIENNGLWGKVLMARETLIDAEEKIIDFAISIVPKMEGAALKEAVKTNYTTRSKVIDLTLQLDVSTITT